LSILKKTLIQFYFYTSSVTAHIKTLTFFFSLSLLLLFSLITYPIIRYLSHQNGPFIANGTMVIDLTETDLLPLCFHGNFHAIVSCWIAEDDGLPKTWKKNMKSWDEMTPRVQAKFLSLWTALPDTKKAKIISDATNPTKVALTVDEKRAGRYVSSPAQGVLQRIARALQQRLFLISQENDSTEDNIHRKFVVLGSTGNVYNVEIGRRPSCTCPDHAKSHLCKHILFVLLKVLRVPARSPLVYQKALLQVELKEIFERADVIAQCSVQAKNEVVRAYNEKMGTSSSSVNSVDVAAAEASRPLPEGECAICFDMMSGRDTVEMCCTCKNFLHRECLQKWLSQSATCCYCRSPWPKAAAGGRASGSTAAERAAEGFMNLGALQGVPEERDTSSYHSYSSSSSYAYGGHWGYGNKKKRRYY
jgi:hypothetical protein